MSNRDCPDSPNGPSGPNQGQGNNMPDLYQWSGQPSPQGGDPCHGHQEHQGGPGQAGSDQGSDAAENPAIANWHPDYTYSSPAAKAWLKDNEQTRDQSLQMSSDGTYTVQFGDCLSTIAERALKDEGNKTPDWNQINGEMTSIIQANDKKYSSLDYNKDYLQAGWKLRLPGEQTPASGPQGASDAPAHHQCVPHPEGNTPYFPPPPGYHGRPSCIINNYYIRGNAYINEGGGPGGPGGPGGGQGSWQNPGQMSPQHRFKCHGNNGQGGQGGQANQADSYYGGQQGYNPSMQYQWQPYSGNGGDQGAGNGNYPYGNPSNWNNQGGNGGYAQSWYYNQGAGQGGPQAYEGQGSQYGQYQIQPIPNAVPGEGQAIPIPNATGNYQAQPIGYETQQYGSTYPAQYQSQDD